VALNGADAVDTERVKQTNTEALALCDSNAPGGIAWG
jgi:hypothetical protein